MAINKIKILNILKKQRPKRDSTNIIISEIIIKNDLKGKKYMNISECDIDLLNLVDIESVLHQLLSQIRNLTFSDAGTIYLKEGNYLKFCVFQNDSLPKLELNHLIENSKFLELPLNNRQYIAVESFLSSKIIKINNIHEEEFLDVSGIKAFDDKFGYNSYSMLTIPLVDLYNNTEIGVLQIINKIKDNKFVAYSDFDVELIKMASNFIGFTISKTIEFKSSLIEMDEVIKKVINNEIEIDRLNTFRNKVLHTSKILTDIAHQWRQPLFELSMNNSYLSSKLDTLQWNEILDDNESIIQSLSSIINDFEMAYEYEDDTPFSVYEAFQISYKLINTYVKNHKIQIVESINKDVRLSGEKNIFIQIILSVLQNSLDVFKQKRIKKPIIEIKVKEIKKELVITFEDNAGGIREDLLSNIFEINKKEKNKLNNTTLNILKIVIRDRFKGKIFAKNGKTGLMIKIIIKPDSYLLESKNG